VDFGAGVEYFIATDKYADNLEEEFWSPVFRLYLREKFINLGVFNFRADVGAIGFRERETDDGTRTYVQPTSNITITTKLSDSLIFKFGGSRAINRKKYAELYFYQDYTTLNPFLKLEKMWCANAALKLHSDRINVEAGGFAQMVDDLVFLNETKNVKDSVLDEISWTPDNLDVEAYIFGGQIKFDLFLSKGMNASIQFIHEFQELKEELQHIPYRPQDTLLLNLSYSSPSGFGFSLTGKANGPRFYNLDSDDTLPPYFLWKLRFSKSFSQYITAFISGEFSSGRYELLKDYELPKQTVDLGISLRF
jgi:hypothetical protein